MRLLWAWLLLVPLACAPTPDAENNPDGNVGAPCHADEDCRTPMDYLIRSVCPYSSACVEGKCAVICPTAGHGAQPPSGASYPKACSADGDCDCGDYPPENLKRCACLNGGCAAIVD